MRIWALLYLCTIVVASETVEQAGTIELMISFSILLNLASSFRTGISRA